MSLFSSCPLTTPLTTLTKQTCPFNLDQVVKMAIWRKGATPFTTATILTQAGWSAAVAGTTDATKAIVTNYISDFEVPNSTLVEQTSDTNIRGMSEAQRGSNPRATFKAYSESAAQISQLKALSPYSSIVPGVTGIVGVFLMVGNVVAYNANSGDLGFDLYNWFISDTNVNAQLSARNMVAGQFDLFYGWADQLATGQVAFDLLNTYPA